MSVWTGQCNCRPGAELLQYLWQIADVARLNAGKIWSAWTWLIKRPAAQRIIVRNGAACIAAYSRRRWAAVSSAVVEEVRRSLSTGIWKVASSSLYLSVTLPTYRTSLCQSLLVLAKCLLAHEFVSRWNRAVGWHNAWTSYILQTHSDRQNARVAASLFNTLTLTVIQTCITSLQKLIGSSLV